MSLPREGGPVRSVADTQFVLDRYKVARSRRERDAEKQANREAKAARESVLADLTPKALAHVALISKAQLKRMGEASRSHPHYNGLTATEMRRSLEKLSKHSPERVLALKIDALPSAPVPDGGQG